MRRRIPFVALVLVMAPTVTLAQDGPDLPAGFDEPMPLHHDGRGLGPFSRTITTPSDQAQLYFDQGIQLVYAFDPGLGARSFREAWKLDPNCAMCYFGEAWAWGPYLNGPMTTPDAPRAHAAISKAMDVRDGNTTPVERAMIEAMAERYEAEHDGDRRRTLDEAWAESMNTLSEAYPNDLDNGFLAGESLMLLEPRRGRWDIEKVSIQRIHRVLEDVLSKDITHPGACHLYIHSTEPTVQPEKAEGCAAYLGQSIPGASHIQHMPSHTFNRVGRWAESVVGNTQAWHSDMKAATGEGFAIYPSHNLHMLLFAASNGGQGAVAIQAAKEYAKIQQGGQFYQSLTMMRFGRFEDLIALDGAPDGGVFEGMWNAGKGYAHLRMGDEGTARWYLHLVKQGIEDAPENASFRGHTVAQLLGITGGILEGEIMRANGDLDGAIAIFQAASELERGLRYDEPEPLPFSVRQWLGDALWEAGRHDEAIEAFRDELVAHPHNGWSLFGLERSLRAIGDDAEADEVLAERLASWERTDVYLRSPIY